MPSIGFKAKVDRDEANRRNISRIGRLGSTQVSSSRGGFETTSKRQPVEIHSA
jgi:hypothetical protein